MCRPDPQVALTVHVSSILEAMLSLARVALVSDLRMWVSTNCMKISAKVFHSALRMHWQWAGHAARRSGTYNQSAATAHIKPAGRGRPPPHWSQLLRTFSTQELRGPPNQWEILAQDRAEWNTFADIFIQFVETHILRSDTRATLARDSMASRIEET